MFISEHIAPCGINCATCLGFLRDKNKCEGCKSDSEHKPYHCHVCKILNCEYLAKTQSKLCVDCEVFPCKSLKQLDKRYRTKYNSYLIENLKQIKSIGMVNYLKAEEIKWRCESCDGTICVHRGNCLACSKNKTN